MKSFRWSHVISYLIMVIVLVFFAFVLYQVIMLGVHSVSNSFFINFGRVSKRAISRSAFKVFAIDF